MVRDSRGLRLRSVSVSVSGIARGSVWGLMLLMAWGGGDGGMVLGSGLGLLRGREMSGERCLVDEMLVLRSLL